MDFAREAWKRAQENAEQVYAATQLDSNRLSIPKPERCRRLLAASRDLRTADARVSSTRRRNNLIREYLEETCSIRRAKEAAARHRILLPWILEQIPLIEVELGRIEKLEHEPDTTQWSRKRLHSDNDDSWEPITKKRKLSCLSHSLLPDMATVVETKDKQIHKHAFPEDSNGSQNESQRLQAEAIVVMPSSQTLPDYKPKTGGLRRSARLAARRMTAETASISQLCRRKLRSKR